MRFCCVFIGAVCLQPEEIIWFYLLGGITSDFAGYKNMNNIYCIFWVFWCHPHNSLEQILANVSCVLSYTTLEMQLAVLNKNRPKCLRFYKEP